MTLRQALKSVDLDKVYAIINERDQTMVAECDRPALALTVKCYGHVVKELLSKPKVKAYPMPFCIDTAVDFLDKTPYIDVYLRNRRYVNPPSGATPWGGVCGQKIPKGKYNANLAKYNQRYSLMGIRWSKLIDTSIEIKAECSLETAIAHLLWNLTFDGWTEEKSVENSEKLTARLIKSTKEIKDGKCITLPPDKEGGMKIVIPDSVSEQILGWINQPILSQPSNKCKTCWGFGLWAEEGVCPMGRMDASDGMPTKACPECGTNPNPI